jgi:hypothetical protein
MTYGRRWRRKQRRLQRRYSRRESVLRLHLRRQRRFSLVVRSVDSNISLHPLSQ